MNKNRTKELLGTILQNLKMGEGNLISFILNIVCAIVRSKNQQTTLIFIVTRLKGKVI
jgi:hypothetical protein